MTFFLVSSRNVVDRPLRFCTNIDMYIARLRNDSSSCRFRGALICLSAVTFSVLVSHHHSADDSVELDLLLLDVALLRVEVQALLCTAPH